MLLKDSDEGLTVYMAKRPGKGVFPDIYVFPGGKVDETDWAPDICHGLSDQQASLNMNLIQEPCVTGSRRRESVLKSAEFC